MKKYAKTHEWVETLENKEVLIGLTDYAQKELGDIVFISLPEVGQALTIGAAFAEVESVKAVSEIYAPVNGVISAINDVLLDYPEKINQDAKNIWLVKVGEVSEYTELLDEEDYLALVG